MDYNAVSSIIIREEDGKTFLGRRSMKKERAPGKWETIGGAIEEGETSEQAIKREIMEELNVEVDSMDYYKDFSFDEWCFKVFIVKLRQEPIPNKEDFEETGWFSKEEIEKMDFTMNCKERLLGYFSNKN